MRNLITRFVREEDGMEFVEWAIVAALFALVAATGWTTLASSINARLSEVNSCVSTGNC